MVSLSVLKPPPPLSPFSFFLFALFISPLLLSFSNSTHFTVDDIFVAGLNVIEPQDLEYMVYVRSKPKDHYELDVARALFFLESDLKSGKRRAPFLSCRFANSVTFTFAEFQSILERFSIQPRSAEADKVKDTLLYCEESQGGYCATSLEAMLDFTIAALSTKNLQVTHTNARKGGGKQLYTVEAIERPSKVLKDAVACHSRPYIYAIFYCHKSSAYSFIVTLLGEDETTIQVAAVCHIDTAKWNPNHVAFNVLKVKPGDGPICHYLLENHFLWMH